MKVTQRWRLHTAAGCSGIQPATMSEVEPKPGIELGSVPWKSASVDGYTPLQAAAAFSQRRCLKLNRNQGSSWARCHESHPALTATHRCRLQRHSASDDVWSWTETRDRVGLGAMKVSQRWRLHAAAGCSGVQPATMSEVEPKPGIELGSVPWKSPSVDGYTPLQAAAAFSQRRCLKLNRNQGSSWARCHESHPALTATHRCRLQRRSASDDVWSWTETRDRVGLGAMKISQRWRLHAAAGCSGIQPATMSEVEPKPGIELGSVPWKSPSVDGYTPLQAAAAFSQRRCLKLNRNCRTATWPVPMATLQVQ